MSDGGGVGVVMGSDSDWPTMKKCVQLLRDFGIDPEVRILSAHRSPVAVQEYAATADDRGLVVIICAAGLSAALAGSVAAHTTLPVIGVPMAGGPLAGVDALLSTVQMPPGTPVATVGIGSPGAKNAALLAVAILATRDPEIRDLWRQYKVNLAEEVDKKNRDLQRQLTTG